MWNSFKKEYVITHALFFHIYTFMHGRSVEEVVRLTKEAAYREGNR
jgi:hypothetical protein